MGKFELHVHTRECDLYAVSHDADIVKLYHDAGYEGLVITDHYFEFFSDWFADELVGLSARDIAKRRLKGYYEAKNEGEKLGDVIYYFDNKEIGRVPLYATSSVGISETKAPFYQKIFDIFR